MLFCKIPPKELILGGDFLLLVYAEVFFVLEEDLYFQNLNKIPTVKHESKCVTNNKSPNGSISKKRNAEQSL